MNSLPEKGSKPKNRKYLIVIVGLLLIFIGSMLLQRYLLKRKNSKEQQKLVEMYSNKMDSMSLDNVTTTTELFSWAIKGELTRDNLEQAEQLFTALVKREGVAKALLIDPASGKILISTDLKEKGEQFPNFESLLQLDKLTIENDNNQYKATVPVYGITERIGTIIVFFKKQ